MSDILNKLQNISSDEQKIRINLRSLQEEVRNQYELLEKKKLEKKALDNYLDSTPSSQPQPLPLLPPPSAQGRKKYEKICAEICSLIVQKVMYKGSLTWDEAARNFQVSKPSIGRILQKEKKRKTSDSTLLIHLKKKRKKISNYIRNACFFTFSN